MISITSAQLDLWIGMYLWPFVRLLALFMTAPIFHDQAVPARAKIGFSLIVAILVVPLLPPEQYVPISHPNALLLVAQQILIGGALGFSMRLIFTALELAGDLIGLQMGLSFAGFISPSTGEQTPLIGSFLSTLAALIFLAMNGHLLMIAGLVDSFDSLPIDPLLGSAPDFNALAHAGADMFRLGLHIALPVLATMLILNLALGVLARVAPQLNIFAIGFPVTLLIGMIALAMAMPFMGPVFEQMLMQAIRPLR